MGDPQTVGLEWKIPLNGWFRGTRILGNLHMVMWSTIQMSYQCLWWSCFEWPRRALCAGLQDSSETIEQGQKKATNVADGGMRHMETPACCRVKNTMKSQEYQDTQELYSDTYGMFTYFTWYFLAIRPIKTPSLRPVSRGSGQERGIQWAMWDLGHGSMAAAVAWRAPKKIGKGSTDSTVCSWPIFGYTRFYLFGGF